jgi:hypothetical protein
MGAELVRECIRTARKSERIPIINNRILSNVLKATSLVHLPY